MRVVWPPMERAARAAKLVLYLVALCVAFAVDMQDKVLNGSRPRLLAAGTALPSRYTAIVPGCRVNGDDPSACLEERLQKALELYRNGHVQRLLLSGDHGATGYDEVNAMRTWLLDHGVAADHVFLDHAGFDTWDTMVRAREVFRVDGAVVVTQAFHLPRAVFLARKAGLDVVGVAADPPGGSCCAGSAVREPFACAKAVYNTLLGASPRFLGPAIPITGSPAASLDRP